MRLAFVTTVCKNKNMDDVLRRIYFDIKNPVSYSSIDNLYKEARKEIPDLTKSQVREWLSKNEAYSLHKSARKKFPRNPVITTGIDTQWELDLADLSNISRYNDGYKFLLQAIDIGTRFGFSEPIKSKKPEEVAKAFEKILQKSSRCPTIVSSDAGKEFVGLGFQKALKRHKIYHFVSTSDEKCPIVERWNRTIKTRMWRYFTYKNTYRWLDILKDLINSYNHTFHRTLQCSPTEATQDSADEVSKRLRARAKLQKLPVFKFNIGDHVRISEKKGIFEKGYWGNWTKEIFVISERSNKPLPTYKITDLNQQKIAGYFYESQLQKTVLPELHKIEQILKWRTRNGRKQALVRWVGYGPEFDQWRDKSEITDI